MKSDEIQKLEQMDVDIDYILPELFLAYKQRKRNDKEYFLVDNLCSKLIEYYYRWTKNTIDFDKIKNSFVTKYCTNESKIEGVNDDGHYGTDEIKGLREVYEYIHSNDINNVIYTQNIGYGQRRNIFKDQPRLTGMESSSLRDCCIAYTGTELTLMEIHAKLYIYAEFSEEAYYMRNDDRYLPGSGTDLTSWTNIGIELKVVDLEVQRLLEEAKIIKENNNVDELLKYIDRCVKVKCQLIKIHPFFDGNGRTIRAFINKLLEEAGIPPIYIKSNERVKYIKAMHLAVNENDFSLINNFYKMKIVDSIIELDINDRILKQKNEVENDNDILLNIIRK